MRGPQEGQTTSENNLFPLRFSTCASLQAESLLRVHTRLWKLHNLYNDVYHFTWKQGKLRLQINIIYSP